MMVRTSSRCLTRQRKLTGMDPWGSAAMEHCRRHLPLRYRALKDRLGGVSGPGDPGRPDRPGDGRGRTDLPAARGGDRLAELSDGASLSAVRWRPRAGEWTGPRSVAQRLAANLAALEVLRSIEAEARPARPDEQAVLARWSGWGATPAVFADDHADDLDDVRQRLRALLSPEEWDGARRTVLNAHYTDPTVVAAIWDAAARLGFDGGRGLEPGCGSGHFIGLAPPGAAMVGVERDATTAAIARTLYPDAEIHTGPFERFTPAEPLDLVVGNVPFAKVTPTDARF